MEQQDKVKAAEKVTIVLDLIRASGAPIGVNDISRQCGLNVTTAFRILKTLRNSGWVYQNKDEKYIAGPKITFTTETNNFYMALSEVSYYIMSALTAKTFQAMNLAVRIHNRACILQQSRTEKIVDYVPPIGTYLPLYASATGKVLLSELPEPLLNLILDSLDFKPFTAHTITDRTTLINELSRYREKGYAIDDRESQDDGFCIAVPVRCEGSVAAALSFSGIIGRIQEDRIEEYSALLHKAAAEIERNLNSMNGSRLLAKSNLLEIE